MAYLQGNRGSALCPRVRPFPKGVLPPLQGAHLPSRGALVPTNRELLLSQGVLLPRKLHAPARRGALLIPNQKLPFRRRVIPTGEGVPLFSFQKLPATKRDHQIGR